MRSFDGKELIQGLDEFVKSTPGLLRRTAATSQFADKLEAIDISEESPFTLAVVGKMRSGKSTLINTLIGDHSVAKVGTTETTATVNWIRHGDEETCKSFNVHWQGVPGTMEALPRGEDQKWVGDSELCGRTRFLEFFSQADFLRHINIIDTPGSQSVIEQHETTIQEFISAKKKCDDETMYYGGVADCLVYVLPPIAKAHDSELLERFGQDTRIPGASAYNSIGVLNRWEAVLTTERPWDDVYQKAQRMKLQLGRFVSDILVVSGPLHCAYQKLGSQFWEDINRFVVEMSDSALTWSLKNQEKRFLYEDNADCAWAKEERAALYADAGNAVGFVKQFPWQSFAVLLKFAKAKRFHTGEELRIAIGKLAGVDALLTVLERRFFERSRAIRATSRLQKILLPCNEAIQKLREAKLDGKKRIKLALDAQNEVAPIRKEMAATRTLIKETQQLENSRSAFLDDLQKNIENSTQLIRERFLSFDNDMKAMTLLDSCSQYFTEEEQLEILRILGAYGVTSEDRFAFSKSSDQVKKQMLGERHAVWVAKCEQCVGIRQQILEQVIARLEEAINFISADNQQVCLDI